MAFGYTVLISRGNLRAVKDQWHRKHGQWNNSLREGLYWKKHNIFIISTPVRKGVKHRTFGMLFNTSLNPLKGNRRGPMPYSLRHMHPA
jgi:hypothetical protein